jgi:hypothetical protein
MSIAPQSFRDSVGCGCLIAFGLFGALFMLGKFAEWTQ